MCSLPSAASSADQSLGRRRAARNVGNISQALSSTLIHPHLLVLPLLRQLCLVSASVYLVGVDCFYLNAHLVPDSGKRGILSAAVANSDNITNISDSTLVLQASDYGASNSRCGDNVHSSPTSGA
jgi:hypothetical protein